MSWMRLLCIGVFATLLTSPASSADFRGPWDVNDLRAMTKVEEGTAFTRALATEYRSFTLDLVDRDSDWEPAYVFARKGLAAASGKDVAPELPSNWQPLLEGHTVILNDARTKLVSVLDSGARNNSPELAAKAQAAYDCWLKNEADGWLSKTLAWQKQNVAACKGLFTTIIAQLDNVSVPQAAMPPSPELNFTVYFDWDSAKLDGKANAEIARAVEAAKHNMAARITLVGHADLSGPEDYNMRLSLRRADAVRQALVSHGVAQSRQSVTGVGDTEPAVPTARGVREARNRFVSIAIK